MKIPAYTNNLMDFETATTAAKNITTEHSIHKLVVFLLLCFTVVVVVDDVHCVGCFISFYFIFFQRTRHLGKFYTISFYLKCIIYYYTYIHISVVLCCMLAIRVFHDDVLRCCSFLLCKIVIVFSFSFFFVVVFCDVICTFVHLFDRKCA